MIQKYICLFLLLTSISVFSQNSTVRLDTINAEKENIYIEQHDKQLNIKFEISNEIMNYRIPYEGEKLKISPNLNLRYALHFSYKFLSIRLGIRPKISESSAEKKGNSDIFQLNVKLLFNKWSHRLNYTQLKGFYVKNTNDIAPEKSPFSYQFPDLKTKILSGTSTYKINKNYSVKAIESQTEIQIKSAGSFMPSIDYWIYKINGTDKVTDINGDKTIREEYGNYLGLNTIFNMGYYYTFVYKKNWFANAFLTPGIGVNFFQNQKHSLSGNSNKNYMDLELSLQSGISLGYSSNKYYFGATFSNRFTNEKNNKTDFQFQTSNNAFQIFIGYRFKAPKTIRTPIDTIEEKVPILNPENRNQQ